MPLTESANPVEAPKSDFVPVPEDLYQVVISDVEEKIMPRYQAKNEDDVEAFYKFKFVIINGEDEFSQEKVVSAFCTRKWFSGNKKVNPSKLVNLVKAVYAYYYPKLSVVELEADDMTPAVINDLIGKQLRVSVKLNEEGSANKITEFMAIKKELDVPETVKIASVAKKVLAKPSDEPSDPKKEEEDDNNPPF